MVKAIAMRWTEASGALVMALIGGLAAQATLSLLAIL